MQDEHLKVARAMVQFGGGFFSRIGEALFHADEQNRQRIKETWPEQWERYKVIHDMFDGAPEDGDE